MTMHPLNAGLILLALAACESPTAPEAPAQVAEVTEAPAAVHAPQSATTHQARESARITDRPPPLIFVDDELIEHEGTDAAGDVLRALRPEDISRIEVIKGVAAKKLYGFEAEGGVIRIYTKAFDAVSSGGDG